MPTYNKVDRGINIKYSTDILKVVKPHKTCRYPVVEVPYGEVNHLPLRKLVFWRINHFNQVFLDAIAPGPKDPRDWRPPIPFSRIANGFSSSIGAAHDGEAKLKTTPPPTSDSSTASPDAKSLQPLLREESQPSKAAEKRPPSPFRLIQRLQRRYRRAAADEDNPFEDIATRPPPRDQVQMQRVRTYLRRHRKTKKNKRRKFLTRDDIYDPHRNERSRLTKEERRKLREELALKPTSAETEDLPPVKPKQALEERHTRRPVHTGGRILPKDPSTTQEPRIMPTLIPMVDHQLPRLRNNPYRSYDITKPTVIALPIPPNITN
ncbi:hypothetical protein COOONC_23465 [Cooperia oncophora]